MQYVSNYNIAKTYLIYLFQIINLSGLEIINKSGFVYGKLKETINCQNNYKMLDTNKPEIMIALQSYNTNNLYEEEEDYESYITDENVEGTDDYWLVRKQGLEQAQEMQYSSDHITNYGGSGQYYENREMSPVRPRRSIWSTIETYQTTAHYTENTVSHRGNEFNKLHHAEEEWYSGVVAGAHKNRENQDLHRPPNDRVVGFINYQSSENDTLSSHKANNESDLENYEVMDIESDNINSE